jgi:hypothetical protein
MFLLVPLTKSTTSIIYLHIIPEVAGIAHSAPDLTIVQLGQFGPDF